MIINMFVSHGKSASLQKQSQQQQQQQLLFQHDGI